jgi:rhomboid protease GluP
MSTFTCPACKAEWPENYCPICSRTINSSPSEPQKIIKKCGYCGAKYPEEATTCAIDGEPLQIVGAPLPKSPPPLVHPAGSLPPALPASAAKSNPPKQWVEANGNFRIIQANPANPADFRTVSSSRGGVTKGILCLNADGIILRQRLSLAIGALMFLILWIVSSIVFFMVQSLFQSRTGSMEPSVLAVFFPLGIAILGPMLLAWRVRRFERRFAISDIVQADIWLDEVEIQFSPTVAGDLPVAAGQGQRSPMIRKLRFFPYKASEGTEIGQALAALGVKIHEGGLAEKADFLKQLSDVTPKAWVTPTLIGLNILIFITMNVANPQSSPTLTLLSWGADYGPLTVTEHQWWRLLACCFLHASILHISLNMTVLWQAGRIVEKLMGNGPFLLLYLGCGLAGSLTSLWFQPAQVSVGASGAIFGIYAALLGYIFRQRNVLPTRTAGNLAKGGLAFVVLNMVLSVFSGLEDHFSSGVLVSQGSHIDLAAHAGGLVSGLVFGFVAARPLEPSQRRALGSGRFMMLFTCICLTLGLLFIPVQKSNQCDIPRMTLLAGMYYRGEGVARNPEAAIRWFQQAAEQGDLNSEKVLGAAYERGDGVAQDSTEAVRWYTQAGEQGDIDSEKFLVGAYLAGHGVPTNNLEAVVWLTKLANQNADQDLNALEKALANAYYHGDGVPQNEEEADKWLLRVADRSDPAAREALKRYADLMDALSVHPAPGDVWLIRYLFLRDIETANSFMSDIKNGLTLDEAAAKIGLQPSLPHWYKVGGLQKPVEDVVSRLRENSCAVAKVEDGYYIVILIKKTPDAPPADAFSSDKPAQ